MRKPGCKRIQKCRAVIGLDDRAAFLWAYGACGRRRGRLLCCLGFLCPAQGEDEFRAHAFGADDIDIFIMELDDLLDDGESQSGAGFVPASGDVRLVETLPYLFQAVLRDACAGVPDGDEDFLIFDGRLDGDDGIRLAEFDGVVDEVVEHLLDLAHVRIDVGFPVREQQFDGNAPGGTGSFKGGGGIFDDRIDVETAFAQTVLLRVHGIQGQKAAGQLGQPLRFPQDDVQIFFLHVEGNRPVQHGLDVSFDGGQRGTEIMGNVGDQLSLVFVVILQGFGHEIHGIRDETQLVLPIHTDESGEIAEGVFAGAFPDSADGQADDQPDCQGKEQDQEHEQDLGDIK